MNAQPSIAVALLTCDRREYTHATLRSFAEHNDLSRFRLFHADDASTDRAVPALAQSYGFKTVVRSPHRIGWHAMRLALFERAATMAEWILFLENDCEWVRPFPWALFDYVKKHAQIYCLRLQGAFKGLGQPCMTYHKLDRTKPVSWKPIKFAPEPAQVGFIHWSAQPGVTRAADLLDIHRNPPTQSRKLTARVVENVTMHIGAERTQPVEVPA